MNQMRRKGLAAAGGTGTVEWSPSSERVRSSTGSKTVAGSTSVLGSAMIMGGKAVGRNRGQGMTNIDN